MEKADLKNNSQSSDELISKEKFTDYLKKVRFLKRNYCLIWDYIVNRQKLSRILFMNSLYQQIINIHGIVVEFGVRWGQNLNLFTSFRSIYEHFNKSRKIVGFDTFAGFPSIHDKDGNNKLASVGSYSVKENYEEYLKQILDYHESESSVLQSNKCQIIRGDATIGFEKYLEDHPETIIALAYFD